MPLHIKEVVLENFMSYEYARVPLRPGLNFICGPNGAGKSSILLAISVATGQSYTERSRRLSDLIRRGKDIARVTLIIDNSKVGRRRPIPSIDSDIVTVSRYLKKDGTYWFEVNGREVTKAEITRMFKSIGMNPDNMLIVMHQNMIEQFAVIPPKEKLLLVEEAVGFSQYRRNIKEAKARLEKLLSEEEATRQLLASAEQTLAYWKEVYEKLLEKRRLLERKKFLEREIIWAQYIKHEKAKAQLEERLKQKKAQLEDLNTFIAKKAEEAKKLISAYGGKREELKRALYKLVEAEKASLECEVQANFEKVALIERELDVLLENYVEARIQEAVARFRRGLLEDEVKDLAKEIREVDDKLKELEPELEKAGERIETERSVVEIQEELRYVNAHLMSLRDVPEDAESIYNSYLKNYEELKNKAKEVAENKEKALRELEDRIKIWRQTLEKLVSEVDPVYRDILSRVGGIGGVRLVNLDDMEEAGLELTVGFRGSSPVVLDAYVQSGGERTVAIMAFLLALQQYLKSPIRAVDEFDVHMDPVNREAMMKMLLSHIEANKDVQFIVITPSQISVLSEKVNVIFVQNVQGKSEVIKTVSAAAQRV
ncbi:MAG: hypothetical protein DRJ31_05385 [Candidatus Methanomethylicota archaeon]|uniref:RecF/RecN/SMC N-terminal domain-containing protein n=2 Tax=Thermoproteota archaeon TaxID=2056631 RepID=A0A497EQ03_9CREN|nr:MAG: hypothetical protein DRJ31_05385 [Candidatus Verstraetearchaeota archaeon]